MLHLLVTGKVENIKELPKGQTNGAFGVFVLRERVWDGGKKPDRLWMVYFKEHHHNYVKRQAEAGYSIAVHASQASGIPAEWGKEYDEVVARLDAHFIGDIS